MFTSIIYIPIRLVGCRYPYRHAIPRTEIQTRMLSKIAATMIPTVMPAIDPADMLPCEAFTALGFCVEDNNKCVSLPAYVPI